MPPDPLTDEDENYASSEDSDFAPDAVNEQASEPESEAGDDEPPSKRRRTGTGNEDAEDAGYDNSGDEAIIQKGKKRRNRAQAKGAAEDDEGGEGGLVKTRRQRAQEKEERKYAANTGPVTVDIDAIWAQMSSGKSTTTDQAQEAPQDGDTTATSDKPKPDAPPPPPPSDDPSAMIRIKRTYNFAGRVHTEEKLVARDSAEAKLHLAAHPEDASSAAGATSPVPSKHIPRKAFRSAFEPRTELLPQRGDLNLSVASRMQQQGAKKLNTVEKSRMDWAGYVDKEGIKDELELAGRSKGSYAAREDFLARSEARRDEDARRARVAARV